MNSFLSADYAYTLIARIVVVMTALPVHECAHAYVAHKMGDDTAKNMGRMTLNPLVHLDVRGTILLLIAGFGFAKPVPINPNNFKNRKVGEIATSVAGPLSNIIMALITLCIYRAVGLGTYLYGTPPLQRALAGPLNILGFMVVINCMLAIFNLLPLPPLDGWHVLAQFLPARVYNRIVVNQGMLSIVLIFAVIFGFLDGVLGFLGGNLVGLLYTMTDFIEHAMLYFR